MSEEGNEYSDYELELSAIDDFNQGIINLKKVASVYCMNNDELLSLIKKVALNLDTNEVELDLKTKDAMLDIYLQF